MACRPIPTVNSYLIPLCPVNKIYGYSVGSRIDVGGRIRFIGILILSGIGRTAVSLIVRIIFILIIAYDDVKALVIGICATVGLDIADNIAGNKR